MATIKSAKKARNRPYSRKLNGILGQIGAAPRLVNDRSPPQDQLTLAFRAVERRATGLGDPGDDPAATVPRARQSFAIVDLEDVLEIAQVAVGLPVIAQSRSAGFDRFLERRGWPWRPRSRPGSGRRVRSRECSPASRARDLRETEPRNIDIAESCDALLVEQTGLEGRAGARK